MKQVIEVPWTKLQQGEFQTIREYPFFLLLLFTQFMTEFGRPLRLVMTGQVALALANTWLLQTPVLAHEISPGVRHVAWTVMMGKSIPVLAIDEPGTVVYGVYIDAVVRVSIDQKVLG